MRLAQPEAVREGLLVYAVLVVLYACADAIKGKARSGRLIAMAKATREGMALKEKYFFIRNIKIR